MEANQSVIESNQTDIELNDDLRDVMISPVENMPGYYYGRLLDFKVVIYGVNCYVNAAKLCTGTNKSFEQWWNLKGTIELTEAFSELKGISVDELKWKPTGLNNKCTHHKAVSGTYLHQKLITDFASWVNVKFRLKVGDIVLKFSNDQLIKEKNERILKLKNSNTILKSKNSGLEIELSELKAMMSSHMINSEKSFTKLTKKADKISEQNEEQTRLIKTMGKKIDVSSANMPEDPKLMQQTVIMDTHYVYEGLYHYVVIRAQKRSVKRLINRHIDKDGYQDSEILLKFENVPNAIHLHNAIKESEEASANKIKVTGTTIKVPVKISTSRFKRMVKDIYESRKALEEEDSDTELEEDD